MKHSLLGLIKQEYIKSIIFPLLIIETMLLAAYFWSNAYVNDATQKALVEETKANINEIAQRSATIVNNEFHTISNMTVLFQKGHETFFSSYNPLHVSPNDSLYRMTDDGVIINAQRKPDSCTIFYSNVQKERTHRMEKAIATESMDDLYNSVLKSNENIAQLYFNSHDSMNRLCPYMKDALDQYPHDIDIPIYNFYYLADTKHNPKKGVVWTDAYLDPAGAGWMISAIAPVYKGDFLEGVVGIDVTIDNLITNILSIKLPYTSSAMLVDKAGNILAMDSALEPLLGLRELTSHTYDAPIEQTISKPKDFNLFSNTNALSKHLSTFITGTQPLSYFQDPKGSLLMTQNIINETGWRLILVINEESLLAPTNTLKKQTDTIGYLALLFMALFYLGFLAVIIHRSKKFSNQILTPIQNLITATETLKGDLTMSTLEYSGIKEIDTLLENFTTMGRTLQDLYTSMESKIAQGIEKNMEAQKIMIHQSRLAQMGEMISMIAHQWRQPLGSIGTVLMSIKLKSTLNKFDLQTEEGRLEHKTFLETSMDKMDGYVRYLTTTIDDFRNFFKPDQDRELVTISDMIQSTVAIIGKSLEIHSITLHVNNTSQQPFFTYGKKITQVLMNIIKNAHDAIVEHKIENGTIWINAYEQDDTFIIEIEDNAGGIKPDIMHKIFDPYFSTKNEKNGTGLGLYMSKMIIEQHCRGTLKAENTDAGVKFSIHLKGESPREAS
jgi:signal transduction histidine kinase